jgi:hypothetical protein
MCAENNIEFVRRSVPQGDDLPVVLPVVFESF